MKSQCLVDQAQGHVANAPAILVELVDHNAGKPPAKSSDQIGVWIKEFELFVFGMLIDLSTLSGSLTFTDC